MTGEVGGEEEVPSLAGATLHTGEDDSGHLHPHLPLQGQLPQHQAVHVAMRERPRERQSVVVSLSPEGSSDPVPERLLG